MRSLLETTTKIPVKAHRTAEKCIRLLQKKSRGEAALKAVPESVFLISWANAPALVDYLHQANHVTAKAVVLCDQCGAKVRTSAQRWALQYPLVDTVAASWEEAVSAAAGLLGLA